MPLNTWQKFKLYCPILLLQFAAKTECQKQIEQAKSLIASGVVDIFLPVCKPDGTFAPKQCNVQGCFCVDEITGLCVPDAECRIESDVNCGKTSKIYTASGWSGGGGGGEGMEWGCMECRWWEEITSCGIYIRVTCLNIFSSLCYFRTW